MNIILFSEVILGVKGNGVVDIVNDFFGYWIILSVGIDVLFRIFNNECWVSVYN